MGDNLALNGCLGFLRGFIAKFICRICTIPKDQREKATREQVEFLRNKENYEECLRGRHAIIDERKGVKYNCVLNFLDNYKVYENFSVDLMHDCFLGVFKTDIFSILNYYIQDKKVFSLADFNQGKKTFDYGKKNDGNKTADILEVHLTNGLQMNAKEVWTLVEFLPLMLINLVYNYENCPVFKFSLKTGEILDSITKSKYSEDDIEEMLTRVEEHHKMFLELFSTSNSPKRLTPKFHTMLHYGTIVRLIGPLKKTMVFRFEQKHQELKKYARACHSRVNLPLSLCRKFSLDAANTFLYKKNIFGKIKEVIFKPQTNLLGVYACAVSNPMRSVKYKAVSYVLGDILFHQNEIFKLEEIVLESGKEVLLLFSKQLICQFKESLGFFMITGELEAYKIIKASELCFAPVNSHSISNNDYIKIKYF